MELNVSEPQLPKLKKLKYSTLIPFCFLCYIDEQTTAQLDARNFKFELYNFRQGKGKLLAEKFVIWKDYGLSSQQPYIITFRKANDVKENKESIIKDLLALSEFQRNYKVWKEQNAK